MVDRILLLSRFALECRLFDRLASCPPFALTAILLSAKISTSTSKKQNNNLNKVDDTLSIVSEIE